MKKFTDLSGLKFGKLTVISRTTNPSNKNKKTFWLCQCDCGEQSVVDTSSLTSEKTTQCWSCAHYQSALHKRKDYTGQKFGMLTVVKMIYPDKSSSSHSTKAECMCECGNIITRSVDSLLRSRSKGSLIGCGCHRHLVAKEHLSKDIVHKQFGRLKVIGYKLNTNARKNVVCVCDCGTLTLAAKADLLSGKKKSCGCLHKEAASEANAVDYSNIAFPYGIKIVERYKQNSRGTWLWKFQCGICGEIFYEVPARILCGHIKSCGKHNHSIGERHVETILNQCDVKYVSEFSTEGCKYIKPLKFDFAVFDKETDKLKCLIEYDGKQHFEPIEHFGGESSYIISQKRDRLKNEYCKNNNINLVRLPYYLTEEEIRKQILCVI